MRLVLCGDNRVLGEALAAALAARGHRALAITTTAEQGVAAVAAHQPDACLMDLRFAAGDDGLSAARIIRDKWPDTAVVLLSAFRDPADASAARDIGAAGYLVNAQNAGGIAAALDAIAAGRKAFDPAPPARRRSRSPRQRGRDALAMLTPREKEVLRRLAAGQGTGQMAGEMGVSKETLRTYVKNVLAKLGAHSRMEAVALANRQHRPGGTPG